MAELSVTDVHRALRQFADEGYDVLKDPTALHLEDKPYRLVVDHSLYLEKQSPKYRMLHSQLMQSERPLISVVGPRHSSVDGRPFTWTRVLKGDNKWFSVFLHNNNYKEMGMYWPGYESKLEEGTYSDVHEALEHHKTMETPSEFSPYQPPHRLVDFGEPFDRKIRVYHSLPRNVTKTYLYDPATERLINHG